MPRHTLPSQMKKFRSFDVLLTQTREEDIWGYFQLEMADFKAKSKFYISKQEAFLEENKVSNPYGSDFFRSYDRRDRYILADCLSEDQTFEMFEFNKKFGRILIDLELCSGCIFDEESDEDKREKIFEWTKDISSYFSELQYLTLEFTYVDSQSYQKAKQKYFEKRQREKEEMERKNKHSFHGTTEGPHSYECHGRIVYYMPDCEYCIVSKQNYDLIREKIEEDLKKQKEVEEALKMFQEEQKKKQEEQELIRQEILLNLPTLCCEDCQFETKSKYEMDLHNKTREHLTKLKMKQWYCHTCGVQSRSEIEWSCHVNSRKHKNATDVTEKTFRCEACDYTCNLKHHYEQHCKSKKHLKMTSN